MAKRIFKSKVKIAAKVPGIDWWYDTANHAAEATAGLFTGVPDNLSVYKSIADTLEILGATFNFTCAELSTDEQRKANASCNPQKLVEQVLGVAEQSKVSIAWGIASAIAKENASAVEEYRSYNWIIDVAINRSISYFTYLRLGPELMKDTERFERFQDFVKGMNERTPITFPVEASPSASGGQ
ncbi:unnamed protein product [Sphagnum jensenii]|uniref:Beta-amylase n=1 Tax=Sphagnum jensenii TaxID=128206 RepID=A0ABP1A9D8_9BRYO